MAVTDMLPQLQAALQLYEEIPIYDELFSDLTRLMCTALLVSTCIGGQKWKRVALQSAQKMLQVRANASLKCFLLWREEMEVYHTTGRLQTGLSLRKGLRSSNILERSFGFERNLLQSAIATQNCELVRGLSILDTARMKLKESALERRLIERFDLLQARILYFQGEFDQAQEMLTKVKVALGPYLDIAVQVECELGRIEKACKMVVDAVPDMSQMTPSRRIRHHLLYAEVLICHEQFCEALRTLDAVTGVTQWGSACAETTFKIRFAVAKARVYQRLGNHPAAVDYWERVIDLSRPVEWSFVAYIALLSLGKAERALGISDSSRRFQEAGVLQKRVTHQHWFGMLGSSWLQWLKTK